METRLKYYGQLCEGRGALMMPELGSTIALAENDLTTEARETERRCTTKNKQ